MDTTNRIRFSVDLVDAAARSTGALAQRRKHDREEAVRRYRDFWRLAKEYPGEALVPAADIDEIWHLHMLRPAAYLEDCERYFGAGYILDHQPSFSRDDEEQADLPRKFALTARRWTKHFGKRYAQEGRGTATAGCQGILVLRRTGR